MYGEGGWMDRGLGGERDARLSVSLRRFVCLRSRMCVVMTDRGVVLVCVCSFVGPKRKLYLPGGLITASELPSYLDGKLAGDYGFDPLGLGADGAIEQYRVAEVLHARWAMLAVPGIVIPEALGIPGGVWTETGKVFLDGETGRQSLLEFWPIYAAIQVGLMGAAEKFRTDGTGPAGFVPFKGEFTEKDFKGLDPINPGGPLDFFNVAATPQDLAILKVKEIKNGRCVSRLVSSRCVIA